MALKVDKPPPLDVPPELQAALDANAAARQNFADMAPSHRRAYVEYVAEAKSPETRARRAQRAVERLSQGGGAWE